MHQFIRAIRAGSLALVLLASSVWAAETASSVSEKLEANKKAVLGFYKGVSRFDFEAARPFIGDTYTQHSPMIEDGLEGLKKAQDGYKEKYKGLPLPSLDVKFIFAEGDYVVMLSHIVTVPGTPGIACADLFRLENGKLVEHWDITDRLAAEPAGTNMFDQMYKPGNGPGRL